LPPREDGPWPMGVMPYSAPSGRCVTSRRRTRR